MEQLHLYNSLSRRKELFEPLNPPFVGLYLCGPTVYSDPHLGNARSAVNFDILYRYLLHLGYRVRYVRNITDVGHLEGDADEGEDKIGKKARLEQVEPMEIAQRYADRYLDMLDQLNVLRPSIVPRATGHIPEQIALVESILAAGYAYVAGGSVYFDVPKYARDYPYGALSGRTLDEMLAVTRELEGTTEKRHPADFALWKRAAPEHLMRWQSPWGEGFPGWHLECTVMSTKYLGNPFDVHGGGMDLKFPHHEAEMAQTNACCPPGAPTHQARYWLHNNMVTLNGAKMTKSLGNTLSTWEIYAGSSPLLTKAYSPMATRFFILQAHYRSTLDFTDAGLAAAEKGLGRLMGALAKLPTLTAGATSSLDVAAWERDLYGALNDDLNTAVALAELFKAAGWVHAVASGEESLDGEALAALHETYRVVLVDVLGLKPELDGQTHAQLDATLGLLVELRLEARKAKNWALSDRIRDELKAAGIQLNDGPQGTSWVVE
ncbi:MAG: cysteine--tRNA ligase [Bacteroidia bacterium]|nr:cysteine--tRNA ligase [Bacteroidia bacterium]